MWKVVAALACLLLAGCAQSASDESEPVQGAGFSVVEEPVRPQSGRPQDHSLGVTAAEASEPGAPRVLSLDRRVLVDGVCDGTCSLLRFRVPEASLETFVDARVFWDGTASAGFEARIEVEGEVAGETVRGFDVSRAVAWSPGPAVHVLHADGTGAFRAEVRLRDVGAQAVPGPDRLPNLVTLTPIAPTIEACLPEEQVEDGAERCLRLGNSVGNVGDGPLEVHLDHAEGVLATGGLGRFMQRVYSADGAWDREASAAELHPTHGHFHYAGLAHFELHEHDVETGLRGDLVAVGHKRGFCFLDWGPMETPESPPEEEEHAEQNCLVPEWAEGWSMGISRGWYDYYWKELADQYIDIAGVPDGTYELASIADGAATLLETDETDNVASLIIRIQGDAVEVLEERALYANPEQEPT